jgi:predicted DNA-binding protein
LTNNRKLIAVRVAPELYEKIKYCSDRANNSVSAWLELILKQKVTEIYGMINKSENVDNGGK